MSNLVAILVLSSSILGQATEVNVPPKALEQFKYHVGEWEAKGEGNNGIYTIKMSCELAPGKHVLINNGSLAGPAGRSYFFYGIWGWDAAEKKIKTVLFWTGGMSAASLLEIKSDNLVAGDETFSTDDGKRGEGKVSIETNGENKYTYRTTGRTVNGESKPDVELLFTRIKGQPNRKEIE